MSSSDNCPACKANWVGDPIPEAHREFYGSSTHFKREIGIYDRDRDITARWKCPDCNAEFDRFTMAPIPCSDWITFAGGK